MFLYLNIQPQFWHYCGALLYFPTDWVNICHSEGPPYLRPFGVLPLDCLPQPLVSQHSVRPPRCVSVSVPYDQCGRCCLLNISYCTWFYPMCPLFSNNPLWKKLFSCCLWAQEVALSVSYWHSPLSNSGSRFPHSYAAYVAWPTCYISVIMLIYVWLCWLHSSVHVLDLSSAPVFNPILPLSHVLFMTTALYFNIFFFLETWRVLQWTSYSYPTIPFLY